MVGKSKYLSKEEVRELIKKSHAGDMDARELIVEKNMRLVWNVVHRFINRGYLPEDLFQIGCIGLLKSIDKFDLDYDVAFSTYAVPMIIGEIQRFIRDDGTVKVPRTIKELANKIRHADLVKEEPAAIIKALELGDVSEDYIKLAVKYIRENGGKPLSTDETVYENDGDPITIGDQMGGDINGSNWLDSIALRQAIDKLDDREKTIVYLRYYQDKTQTETAEALGVSQVQVSRLEKRIVAKMKDGFNEEEKEVVKPEPKATKMVIAVKETKKQEEKETITMGNNKSPKGNREEAIRLLESTELTYKEIAARTEVPLSTVGGLAGTHRSKAVKNKNRAKNAPRKGNKKSKNKETMPKNKKTKAAKPKQTSIPIVDKVPTGIIDRTTAPKHATYEVGIGEKSDYMERVEARAKELAQDMTRVSMQPITQVGDYKVGVHTFRDGTSGVVMCTDKESPTPKSTSKVEYNFNFNVSGKQVSIDEVITKLDELKAMLSHIPVDAVNFRINVGS
ncbi:RNA polymerase sigma factor [Bacillus phage Eldridge]|uniref:Sporulation sigma factor SigF n=1 Tax=Bacillus phage Eldridge TaxID=1776293 RepID=A0A0Y0AU18_9CAUD|nr:RNA polymerase sigma factor [Bacillus phage Eldridge]AMB18752.1 sporulation sigma factor SigF [Bacillus phage Eldridge]